MSSILYSDMLQKYALYSYEGGTSGIFDLNTLWGRLSSSGPVALCYHAADEMSDDALGNSLPCFTENTCQLSETGRKRIALSHPASHFIPQMLYGIQVKTVRAGQSIRRIPDSSWTWRTTCERWGGALSSCGRQVISRGPRRSSAHGFRVFASWSIFDSAGHSFCCVEVCSDNGCAARCDTQWHRPRRVTVILIFFFPTV